MTEDELRIEVERRLREQHLANRQRPKFELTGEDLESVLEQEANRVMPFLLQVREELGEDGPLSDDQFNQASMRKAQAGIAGMWKILDDRARAEADPEKRKFLAQFAANVSANLNDLRSLKAPGVTEEMVSEVTSKIVERMNAMTEARLLQGDSE